MKYLSFSILLILVIAQLSAQEFKSITVGEYKTTIKDKRLALVIGNNEYEENKLSNPVKDAKAIKSALEACGFDVIIHENGTEKSIKEKVREFSEKLKNYDVGMFYYSGHGVELNGINYIVPIDIVHNATAADIAEECIATEFILSKMGEAGRTNKTYIMVLDACRDNPFKNIFKDLGNQIWKAPSVVPSGSITCFAASQGEKAIEGKDLSPYTELFLKHMKTPGLEIEDVFKRVRIDLDELKRSNPQIAQEPVEMNKLKSDFYFVPANVSMSLDVHLAGKTENPGSSSASLKIFSNMSGSISIDGKKHSNIEKDGILVIDSLNSGEHFVQLIAADGTIITEIVKISASSSNTLKFEQKNFDKDKDNIPDADDSCPDNYGPVCTKGCPDKDSDCIADKLDNCPDQKGNLNGCPDTDSDGIADKYDNCPNEQGTLKGCPDTDNDGIADKDDKCPKEKGSLNGCPDADSDGIADKDDKCPKESGSKNSNGCPDRDNDGIADKDDNCPDLKGKAPNRGCPTEALLRYTGDNLGCALNITIDLGGISYIPNSNKYFISIEEGTYNYIIKGTITCPARGFCNINSSGTINIRNRSILDVTWDSNCGAALINTGAY